MMKSQIKSKFIVILLTILGFCFLGFGIILSLKDSNSKNMVCTNQISNNDMMVESIYEISISKNKIISGITNTVKYSFYTEEAYNTMTSQIENDLLLECFNTNRGNLSFSCTQEISLIDQETNNQTSIDYNVYKNNLEDGGYTCIVK